MKKREIKKLLALVLCFSLVFTMAVPSFAADEDTNSSYKPNPTKSYGGVEYSNNGTYNYLVLGDSMTNGYGTEAYSGKYDGFNQVAEGIYSDLFAEYLSDTLQKKVNLYQYAFTALRAEDVAAFLFNEEEKDNPNYVGEDVYTKNYILEDRVKNFSNTNGASGYQSGQLNSNYTQLKKDYRAAVENADFISVALGMNNYSMMFWEILSRNLGVNLCTTFAATGTSVYNVEDLLNSKQKSLYNIAKNSINNILKNVNLENNSTTVQLISDLMYSIASFYINYDKLVNRIYELNGDATVAFIGFSNAVRDVKASIDINGITIPNVDIEKIIGVIFDTMSAYIKYESMTYKGNSFYVDYNDCELIGEEIASTSGKVDFDSYNEGLMLDGICADPFAAICQGIVSTVAAKASSETITVFNRNNIQNGVKAIDSSDNETKDNYKNCALIGQVYKGMRTQILKELTESDTYGNMSLNKVIDTVKVLFGSNEDKSGLIKALVESVKEDEIINALNNITSNDDMENLVVKMLESNEGLKGIIYIYAKLAMGSGFAIHISNKGHETEANKIISAYEKFEKKAEVKSTLKKAVPVVVGGVAVALITSSVVKKLKANSDADVEESEGTEVSEGSTFMEKLSQAIITLKEKFAELIEKIKAGNSYEFIYQRNE